jgi:hypothetical protein
MRTTLKVLFLAADPFTRGAPLQLDEEVRAIDEALQRGSARDRFELVSHFATRTRDLQRALLEYEPDILHFGGHGRADGVIYLGDDQGQPRAVTREALGRLFQILDGEVRAVVLNACNTLSAVESLSEVVDFAIGTNRRITDGTAIEFSAAFYTALAYGRGVPQSFALAVNQLQLDSNHEADVPVLRVRRGAAGTPLLSPVETAVEAVAAAASVTQSIHVDDIVGGRVNVVGQDGAGAGTPVDQRFRARTITGADLNFTGVNLRPGRN